MIRSERKDLLKSIQEGDYILCINSRECTWRIYRANEDGSSFMSMNRDCVFIDPDYYGPNDENPRNGEFHYRESSARYEFNVDSVHITSVRAVFKTQDDYAFIVEQLTEAEFAYVEATKVHRDRFAVLAKLLME